MSKFTFFKRTGKGVAERWLKQYAYPPVSNDPSHRRFFSDKNREETYINLAALGENPDPDRVDAIIGNGSWTRAACFQHDEARYVGQAVIIETSTFPVTLCMECIGELERCIKEGKECK